MINGISGKSLLFRNERRKMFIFWSVSNLVKSGFERKFILKINQVWSVNYLDNCYLEMNVFVK